MASAQRRSNPSTSGISSVKNKSLLSFSSDQIISAAHGLGISLGTSKKDEIASANLILDNERNRSLTMLQTNESNTSLGDKAPHCLVVTRASNLCEDLVDDEETPEDTLLEVPPVKKTNRQKKKKNSNEKIPLRRSTRVKYRKLYS